KSRSETKETQLQPAPPRPRPSGGMRLNERTGVGGEPTGSWGGPSAAGHPNEGFPLHLEPSHSIGRRHAARTRGRSAPAPRPSSQTTTNPGMPTVGPPRSAPLLRKPTSRAPLHGTRRGVRDAPLGSNGRRPERLQLKGSQKV